MNPQSNSRAAAPPVFKSETVAGTVDRPLPGLPLSVNSHSAIFHGDAAHIGSIKNDDPRFEWNPLFRVQRSGMPPLRNYLAVEAEEEVGPITLHDKPLGGSGFAWHGYVFSLRGRGPRRFPRNERGSAKAK